MDLVFWSLGAWAWVAFYFMRFVTQVFSVDHDSTMDRVYEYVSNSLMIAGSSGAKNVEFMVVGSNLDYIYVPGREPDQIVTYVLNKFTGRFVWNHQGAVTKKGDGWRVVITL